MSAVWIEQSTSRPSSTRPELHSNSVTAISFETTMERRLGLCVSKKDTVALLKLYKNVCKQANTGHERCVYNTALVIKHHLYDHNFWGS